MDRDRLRLTPLLALFTVLSVNACGPFGDGCDEYGQTAPGFELFAVGTVIALVMAVAGTIVCVTAAVRHRPRINYRSPQRARCRRAA